MPTKTVCSCSCRAGRPLPCISPLPQGKLAGRSLNLHAGLHTCISHCLLPPQSFCLHSGVSEIPHSLRLRGTHSHPGEGEQALLAIDPTTSVSAGSCIDICNHRSSESPWSISACLCHWAASPLSSAIPLTKTPHHHHHQRVQGHGLPLSPKFLDPIPHSQPRLCPCSSSRQQWLLPDPALPNANTVTLLHRPPGPFPLAPRGPASRTVLTR